MNTKSTYLLTVHRTVKQHILTDQSKQSILYVQCRPATSVLITDHISGQGNAIGLVCPYPL